MAIADKMLQRRRRINYVSVVILALALIVLPRQNAFAKYYHLTNNAGPSSSYEMFAVSEASGTRVDTGFCTASTGAAKIGTVAWITPTGADGFASDTNINGTWYFSMQVSKYSGATSEANLYAKVYRYSDSLLLFTTGNSANFTGNTFPVAWSYTAVALPIISAGERIYVEFWNNCVNAAPGFAFQYNDYQYNAYINMPMLSADLKITSSDISFDNATPDVGSSVAISAIVTNEGGWYSNATSFASFDTGGDTNYGVYNGQWIAEPFTVASSLYLSKVSINVVDGGTDDDLTLEIQTNSGGSPSGTKVSGTSSYTLDATLNNDWWDAEIQPPVSLSAGTYWIVAKNTNAALANGYAWLADTNGGSASCKFSTNQGSSWNACAGGDSQYYRVYSASEVAVKFYDGAACTSQISTTQNLLPIGPGNSRTAQVTWPATPAGSHTICVRVDEDAGGGFTNGGSITEVVEDTNNEATKAITVYDVPDVVINEFMADPDSVGDTNGEYIELYNSTGSSVSLASWTLESTSQSACTLSGSIAAGGYFTICNDSNTSTNGNYTCDVVCYSAAPFLANTGNDTIIIKNGGGTLIDEVYYDLSTSWSITAGKALELKNEAYDNTSFANWATAPKRGGTFSAVDATHYDKGSPKAANIYKTAPGLSSGALVVNELMIDPSTGCSADTDGEYIEIRNTTSSSINLDGFTFKGGSDVFTINLYFPNTSSTSTTVAANGYYVLGRSANTGVNGNYTPNYVFSGMDLNNTGTDAVQLYDYQDSLISTVTYSVVSPWPTLTAGASFELKNPHADINEGSNWGNNSAKNPPAYCDNGTPGNQNSNYDVVNPSWTTTSAGALDFQSSPIVRTGPLGATVYIGNNDGKLYSIAASNGAVNWNYDIGSGTDIKSQPNLYYDATDYIIYFGAEDGKVYALDDNGGTVALYSGWSSNPLSLTSPVRSSLIRWQFGGAPTQRLFFGTNDTKMYSVNALTGATVTGWPSASLNGVVTSTPAIPNDSYVYVGTWGGKIYQLDWNDGTVLKSSSSFTKITGSPSIRFEKLYFASWDNQLHAIQVTPSVPATNMSALWAFDSTDAGDTLQEFEGTPFVSGNFIYVGNNNGKVYKVNRGDGSLASGWKYPSSSSTLGAVKTSPIVYNGKVYFGSEDGKFYCLVDNGTSASLCAGYPYNTGAAIRTSPAILPSAGKVVVGNASGNVYAFPL